MNRKQKLELTWVGKENRPKLEPRILLEDPERSYHATHRISSNDLFDNRLIRSDNLLALKALEREFFGRIKCVYIDPPFNTGQDLQHYKDGLEHSTWLSFMRDRLQIIRNLLSDDGSLFVHIDDTELGYLIVLLDEIYGRPNRISAVTFKQGAATGHKAINPGPVTTTNFVLIYAKDKNRWLPNRVFTARERDRRYNGFISNRTDDYRRWKITTLIGAFASSVGIAERGLRKGLPDLDERLDEFVLKNAESVIRLARPDYNAVSAAARELIDASRTSPDQILHLERADHSDMYFVRGERILFYSDKLKLLDGKFVAGEPLTNLWDDIASNNLHKEGGVAFPKGKKPEALIKRVLELSTSRGDWVLDSFAGSGTTGAVAHKMGRQWILVESGEHCETHIVPRLQSVISGLDASGITKVVSWQGGGGFRYFRLAPSLMDRDRWGNWVINPEFNASMLAEAVCKLEGFEYAPSDAVYWQHGRSTERDFIYVTTQNLSTDQLQHLSDEVGPERTLLVLCFAFRGDPERYPNLTLKKIPLHVLSRCEWGCDDYSLNVQNLPQAPERQETSDQPPQTSLFEVEAGA